MKLVKEEVADCLRDRSLDSVRSLFLDRITEHVWDCISPDIWKYTYHHGSSRVRYRISMMDK